MQFSFRLLLGVAAFCFPPYVISGDADCKGYKLIGNPFRCGIHGNCVWWAIYKRPELGAYEVHDPVSEQFGSWYEIAKNAGFGVGQSPADGAIAVFSNPSHVAYIEKANNDGSFYASEMDWYGRLGSGDGVQHETYYPFPGGYKRGKSNSVWATVGFIYYRAVSEGPRAKEGQQICDVAKGKCDVKISGSVGWFPPVEFCRNAKQWFIMTDSGDGEVPIGTASIDSCNQAPNACVP